MKTKIINYEPGSKGDFIINFLNDKISFEKLGQSSASAGAETRVIGQSLPNDQLDKYVDILLEKDYEEPFISTHSLTDMTDSMLSRLSQKYELYHINIDDNWRVQANIDYIFKVLIREVHPSLVEKEKRLFDLEKDFGKIEYIIDLKYIAAKIPVNDQNRIKWMMSISKEIPKINISSLINSLSYNDLFSEPFIAVRSLRDMIGKTFDEQLYRFVLKQSFLPKTIKVFNHTFNLEDMGYRYYI